MKSEKNKKEGFWKRAFAIEKAEDFEPTEQDIKDMDAVAKRIVSSGLTTVGILFLETSRPLNFLTAQAMAFFEPVVRSVFSEWEGYSRFYKLLERRGSVEQLMQRIEHHENLRQNELKNRKTEDSE